MHFDQILKDALRIGQYASFRAHRPQNRRITADYVIVRDNPCPSELYQSASTLELRAVLLNACKLKNHQNSLYNKKALTTLIII